MGWIGPVEALRGFLQDSGAETNDAGEVKYRGTIAVGIGGQEAVIGDDAVIVVDGQEVPLAAALVEAGVGVGVVVI